MTRPQEGTALFTACDSVSTLHAHVAYLQRTLRVLVRRPFRWVGDEHLVVRRLVLVRKKEDVPNPTNAEANMKKVILLIYWFA